MIPKANQDWPPVTTIPSWWAHLDECEAWYSGDPNRIEKYYSARGDATHTSRFWRGIADNDERAMHMPLAGDIAAVSAALLFSEAVKVTPNKEAGTEAAADTWRKEFWDAAGMDAMLTEAAEMAAALSGCYLKLDADPETRKTPIVMPVRPSSVLPVFANGQLREATFWQAVRRDDNGKVWYLFEERKRNARALAITYAAFESTDGQTLTTRVDLAGVEEIRAMGINEETVELNMPEGLGVVYVPNRLPNRLAPGNPQGNADYSNAFTLLDALDEAWTSWWRDIRLGMGRLMVSKELMTSLQKFDPFKSVFLQIDIAAVLAGKDSTNLIQEVQFELRTEEHAQACSDLVREIVSRAGYAPQSFGMDVEGQAESGTALRIRERKSLMTRNRKGRYWCCAIARLLYEAQLMQRAALAGTFTAGKFDVEMEDSVVPDLSEMATTIKDLSMAQAISQELAVKMLHPDWNDEDVRQEVERIQSQAVTFAGEFEDVPGGGGDTEA